MQRMSRVQWTVAVASAVVIAAAATTAAASGVGVVTVHPAPNGSSPWGIVAGQHGSMWVTEASAGQLARVAPTGAITDVGPSFSEGLKGLAVGPDGNLWLPERFGTGLGHGVVARVSPAGVVHEFALKAGTDNTLGDIVVGPDKALWFTLESNSGIGRITTAGVSTFHSTPTPASAPYDIAVGHDGNLWFTEFGAGKIGRITPTGHVTEYPLAPASRPWGITAGPDGNVWFTESESDKVGRISMTGHITQFTVPTAPSQPESIESGPDGALWFTEAGGAGSIGRITTSGKVTEFATPTNPTQYRPRDLAFSSDGYLWFTSNSTPSVNRFDIGWHAAARIQGYAEVGQRLTCASTAPTGPFVSTRYRWRADGVPIAKLASPFYFPTASNGGHHLVCERITVVRGLSTPLSAVSPAVFMPHALPHFVLTNSVVPTTVRTGYSFDSHFTSNHAGTLYWSFVNAHGISVRGGPAVVAVGAHHLGFTLTISGHVPLPIGTYEFTVRDAAGRPLLAHAVHVTA